MISLRQAKNLINPSILRAVTSKTYQTQSYSLFSS